MLGATTVTPSSLKTIINYTASKYSVEPALIKAIIKSESNWNPMAYRSEPHIKDASWGLMQVLLQTAREVSGNSRLTTSDLLKPEVNIDVGTRYIAKQLVRYKGNLKSAISAYNAGTANKNLLGKYTNQAYVDKVYTAYKMYSALDIQKVVPVIAVSTIGAVMLMSYMKKG